MSARASKLIETLARQPLSANIANRRNLESKQVNRAHFESEKISTSQVAQYDLSPTRSSRNYDREADIIVPRRDSEAVSTTGPEQMVMTDNVQDLRLRMDAELIALRRAQSIFADTHPSVDIQGKLQDLQEIYIGDILVRDCQITQLQTELGKLKAVPSAVVNTPVDSAVTTGRIQTLQRALTIERQKRMEAELRVQDLTTKKEQVVDFQKQISKLTVSHRLEVSQLKSRLASLQEANKNYQDKFILPKDNTSVPVSPANSNSGEKVSYVKYASLRAEKRQVEARLRSEVERLQADVELAKSSRSEEFEKQNLHHKRVVQDLERKLRLAESAKSEEGKELKDLKLTLNQTLCKNGDLENTLVELRIEMENLKAKIAQKETVADDRAALLTRIEEREDRIRQLQDEAGELDDLLVRAEEDVSSNRAKVFELETKIDASENRIEALLREKEILTKRIEQQNSPPKQPSPKKEKNVEQKIFGNSLGRLERELQGIRASIALNGSSDESCESVTTKSYGTAPTAMATPTFSPSSVSVIENKFHRAVDLCVEGCFVDAVALLEEASLGLGKLTQSEVLESDCEILKVLESDIYGQLGVAFQSLGQIPEAVDAYATAVHVDPEAHACHANLAVLLNHVSRTKEAEQHAKIATDLAPNSQEYANLLEEILMIKPWN